MMGQHGQRPFGDMFRFRERTFYFTAMSSIPTMHGILASSQALSIITDCIRTSPRLRVQHFSSPPTLRRTAARNFSMLTAKATDISRLIFPSFTVYNPSPPTFHIPPPHSPLSHTQHLSFHPLPPELVLSADVTQHGKLKRELIQIRHKARWRPKVITRDL